MKHFRRIVPCAGTGPIAVLLLSSLVACPAAAEVRNLPVPAATISPNDVITGGQITGRRFKVTATSVNGFATERSELIGKQARRRLPAGKPIPLSALAEPVAVRRGAAVTATYQEQGLSISTALVALRDGTAGETIDARNVAAGSTIRATVQADGSLAVSSR